MYPNIYFYGNAPYRQANSCTWTPSKIQLNQKLRSLWVQHIYWTRLTVNSIAGKLPDEDATVERLLRNPTDFEAALQPIYGAAIAARFAELLHDHLTIAAELVKDLQANNTAAATDANKRWHANADDIAELLSRINPYWSKEEWRKMLYEHLRLLTNEVAARLAGKYKENVATNDLIEPQAVQMADYMTNGIIQQFPSLFTH